MLASTCARRGLQRAGLPRRRRRGRRGGRAGRRGARWPAPSPESGEKVPEPRGERAGDVCELGAPVASGAKEEEAVKGEVSVAMCNGCHGSE